MNHSNSFKHLDKYQQDLWEKEGLFKTPRLPKSESKKFYCLDMFPYPSGQGLHVGHPEGYTASDIITRYKRMNGFDVLHPMGWDAFGLPAENYAIETGIHPRITTEKNIDNYRRQIKAIGLAYDWDREINTTDPKYYKWTQWIFVQLFKKGLAYQSTVPINWCPSCKTGLANEEVYNGACERCGTAVHKKNMRQWMLAITKYADRLLDDLEGLDWPESTRTMQKNWIGKSEGAEVDFKIEGFDKTITVFTTRPDTLYGATYMVLAPEHAFVKEITAAAQKEAVENYIAQAAAKTEFERNDVSKEKTGVFTGAYAVNPLNNEKLPVWIADYVLSGYGTGAIMAVPAHDGRDWEFAKKFNIKITEVVKPLEKHDENTPFTGEGESINSGIITGLKTAEAKKKIIEYLEANKLGKAKTAYKLRDWVFARQRYWGEPIPIVHCPKCGAVPIPESQLPLELPDLKEFVPSGTGESPLVNAADWVNTSCPSCKGPAKRETDTMPQWAGSCWYYLRYIDPKNDNALCDKELSDAWLPVDTYIGGTEHAVLHLLYVRFWHKFLYDIGVVSTKEPVIKLRHQGMILAFSYRDNMGVYHGYNEVDMTDPKRPVLFGSGDELNSIVEKMSKSKKNVINPDDVLERYGADAFRMYEMFMGPFEAAKPWDISGIEGIYRFLNKIWHWSEPIYTAHPATPETQVDKKLEILRHKTIAKVTADIEEMHFNTAISAMMIYFNELSKVVMPPKEHIYTLLKILHPFAPHLTEELWKRFGNKDFLINAAWPSYDACAIASDDVKLVVQVNGKVRDEIVVAPSLSDEEIKELALNTKGAKKYTDGKTIVKTIVVPKRLVSIVVK